jgi:hypothetical protein
VQEEGARKKLYEEEGKKQKRKCETREDMRYVNRRR